MTVEPCTSTFAERAAEFYENLSPPKLLPPGISAVLPPHRGQVKNCRERFLGKFFNDNRERVFVLGVNPGRYGSGITGIPLTDPVALEDFCGIGNSFPKRRELSSEFIYQVIERWGGPRSFYKSFFLTAVSPIGFTREGKNFNYYDSPRLLAAITPFIIRTLRRQCQLGAAREAILLGKGVNQRIMMEWNRRFGFFARINVLEHPRFIMQYRRKYLASYVERYHDVLVSSARLSKLG